MSRPSRLAVALVAALLTAAVTSTAGIASAAPSPAPAPASAAPAPNTPECRAAVEQDTTVAAERNAFRTAASTAPDASAADLTATRAEARERLCTATGTSTTDATCAGLVEDDAGVAGSRRAADLAAPGGATTAGALHEAREAATDRLCLEAAQLPLASVTDGPNAVSSAPSALSAPAASPAARSVTAQNPRAAAVPPTQEPPGSGPNGEVLDVDRKDPRDVNCRDFGTRADAKRYLVARATSENPDPAGLDDNNDGVPCEHLPAGPEGSAAVGAGTSGSPGAGAAGGAGAPGGPFGAVVDPNAAPVDQTEADGSEAAAGGDQVEEVPVGSADAGGWT